MVEIPAEIDGKVVSEIGVVFYTEDTVKKEIVLSSVTVIGNSAFQLSSSIEEIQFEGVIIKVGQYAFEGCSALKSLTFKDGLVSLGYCVILVCESLGEVHFGTTNISVDEFLQGMALEEKTVLYGRAGSSLEEYAIGRGVKFVAE